MDEETLIKRFEARAAKRARNKAEHAAAVAWVCDWLGKHPDAGRSMVRGASERPIHEPFWAALVAAARDGQTN
jgi:hypothetical protein